MFKKLITVAALAIGCLAPAPALAVADSDISELVELIQGTGTTVLAEDCSETWPGVYGFYAFDKSQDIDHLVICSDVTDMNDNDEVWDVLSHEATHVMQACNSHTHIIKLEKHPAILRELQTSAPHLYQVLQTYSGEKRIIEAEAFWMMLRSPAQVKEWFKDFCYNQ